MPNFPLVEIYSILEKWIFSKVQVNISTGKYNIVCHLEILVSTSLLNVLDTRLDTGSLKGGREESSL